MTMSPLTSMGPTGSSGNVLTRSQSTYSMTSERDTPKCSLCQLLSKICGAEACKRSRPCCEIYCRRQVGNVDGNGCIRFSRQSRLETRIIYLNNVQCT